MHCLNRKELVPAKRHQSHRTGGEAGVRMAARPTEGRRGLRNWEDKDYNGNRGVDSLSRSTRTQKAKETKGFQSSEWPGPHHTLLSLQRGRCMDASRRTACVWKNSQKYLVISVLLDIKSSRIHTDKRVVTDSLCQKKSFHTFYNCFFGEENASFCCSLPVDSCFYYLYLQVIYICRINRATQQDEITQYQVVSLLLQ